MNKFKKVIIFSFIFLNIFILSPDQQVLSETAPPIPSRIGGTVIIDGKVLTTTSGGVGITVKVTDLAGSSYDPEAEDSNGLNLSGWYIIDIPLYENNVVLKNRPKSGDKAVVHLYKKGIEVKVLEPAKGVFTVGKSGSTARIDITAISTTLRHVGK